MEVCSFFFFNDTATTEIYTLSLHDALPISDLAVSAPPGGSGPPPSAGPPAVEDELDERIEIVLPDGTAVRVRSEEHTSELQSRQYLVCRLLLEKKKKKKVYSIAQKCIQNT